MQLMAVYYKVPRGVLVCGIWLSNFTKPTEHFVYGSLRDITNVTLQTVLKYKYLLGE